MNDELCFPTFGGVFVNPTSRLALKGQCLEECVGDGFEISYQWDIFREKEPFKLNTVRNYIFLLRILISFKVRVY